MKEPDTVADTLFFFAVVLLLAVGVAVMADLDHRLDRIEATLDSITDSDPEAP